MQRGVLKCAALGSWLLLAGSTALQAQAPCIDFKWDVTKERSLFGATATAVSAGADAATAPAIRPGHLYQVRLKPRNGVRFAVAPGQNAESHWGNAGLLAVEIPEAGSYRVVLELPVWADVAAAGALIAPYDYQGQRDCHAPHKIVVYELPKGSVVLQISATDTSTLKLGITRAPARVR